MARISDQTLERLKSEVSVARLVEGSGVQLKTSGKDLLGRCPFHEDDTASLVVTPLKNLWHCFGCGAAGGPVEWVIKTRGVSFRHAVTLLQEGLPSLAAHTNGEGWGEQAAVVQRATIKTLPAPVSSDADDGRLLGQVADYYHATLKQSPEALAYLESRGITGNAAMQAIDTFKLGFANRTLGLRLPDRSRKAGAEIRGRLERLGVYRESGHEHMNGSLVIPLFDKTHQVVNLYGRKVRDDLRAGTPSHLYLPGPRQGLFNRAALAPDTCDEIIVCEALIDALTFWCAGFKNVTSAYGIEGITDALIEALQQSNAKRVLIAFDRDDAGERGATKLAEKLQAIGLEAWRIVFPKGMDANEYALKVQPVAKSLELLIRKAEWIGEGDKPPREKPLEIQSEPLPSLAAIEVVEAAPAAKEEGEKSEESHPEPEQKPEQAAAPAAARVDPDAQVSEQEIVVTYGESGDGKSNTSRRWRVRGLPKNLSVGALKVNVMVSLCSTANDSHEGRFHVDTFDLYASKARAIFIAQASGELGQSEGILKTDLGRLLLKLEALQDEAIQSALKVASPSVPLMSEVDQHKALALLKDPHLLQTIVADFEACGVVGESTNKLVGYLAAVSRLLDRPLGVVIQSSSAAGKSALMDAVLAFVPEEAKTKYSAMTGQSLFYMGQTSLKHRILALAEEEGASRASYAMKLLQSEGELTIASTGSDPKTGNLVTQEYRVEGPTMLMMTTTAIDLDEELLNRCLVLTVDENREQTKKIHALQREKRTLAGLTKKHTKTAILTTHQHAQRLLKPLAIVNPYADRLTFLDDRTRTRRDHEKYLTLIDTIALLHQYQRTIKTALIDDKPVQYIEVEIADIEAANAIAHEVLGRSLDELPPQTRRLLSLTVDYVKTLMVEQQCQRVDARFTRKALRAVTGWGDTQLKVHLARLVELEYVQVHREGRGKINDTRQGQFNYELQFDGDASMAVYLSGLIDVSELKASVKSGYDANRSGQSESWSGSGRVEVGGQSVGSQVVENLAPLSGMRVASELRIKNAQTLPTTLPHADEIDPVVPYPQAMLKVQPPTLPFLAASEAF
jgi:DNA primase